MQQLVYNLISEVFMYSWIPDEEILQVISSLKGRSIVGFDRLSVGYCGGRSKDNRGKIHIEGVDRGSNDDGLAALYCE